MSGKKRKHYSTQNQTTSNVFTPKH